jgi:hypothetical protein
MRRNRCRAVALQRGRRRAGCDGVIRCRMISRHDRSQRGHGANVRSMELTRRMLAPNQNRRRPLLAVNQTGRSCSPCRVCSLAGRCSRCCNCCHGRGIFIRTAAAIRSGQSNSAPQLVSTGLGSFRIRIDPRSRSLRIWHSAGGVLDSSSL